MPEPKVSFIIQAGGHSRRMGQNKALLPFHSETLIERVMRRVQPLADEVLVIAHHPDDFKFLKVPIHTDILPGLGALGGLYTALELAQNPLVAVAACDMPFASPRLFAHLLEQIQQENAGVVIPRSENGLEPLHAVFRKETCLPPVKTALQSGERKLVSWFSQVSVIEVSLATICELDPHQLAFINLNTPQDYAQALQLASQHDQA